MRMRTRPPKSRRALPMRASLPERRSARAVSVRSSAADTRSGQRCRCGAHWKPQLVSDVQEVTSGFGRAAFQHQLVQDTGPQRNDPRNGMAVVGDLDGFATDNTSQHSARPFSQLANAHSVTHGVYTVAPGALALFSPRRVPTGPIPRR